jgi:L-cysteine desulfidase
MKGNLLAYTVKDILRMEVAPALGCTEPAAVALCSAAAASFFPDQNIDSIELWVDPNIYKNGIAVNIPGTGEGKGIDLAASLGVFCGDPKLKLQVLEPLSESCLQRARELIGEGKVKVNLLREKQGIYIQVRLTKGKEHAEAIITEVHDNIVSLKHNGKDITSHPLLSKTAKSQNEIHKLEAWLIHQSLQNLVALLDDLDKEDLAFIKEGVEINMKLAENGLTFGPGLGVGLALKRLVKEGLLKEDMILTARMLTSAASDARMSGVKMAAMSSAGSGNHGLTATLPIWAVKDYIQNHDETEVLKAIALSHIITAYIKAHTGRLTAICGCSIAAGAGATGGITYLMGGNLHHIAGAIKNVIGDLAGVICDGAKTGCALKLATAAGNAVQSALFSLHGLDIKSTDGIVADSPEKTMKNVGQLSVEGMIETDRTILQILIEKQFDKL